MCVTDLESFVELVDDEEVEPGHEDDGNKVGGDVGEDDEAEEVDLDGRATEGVLVDTLAVRRQTRLRHTSGFIII